MNAPRFTYQNARCVFPGYFCQYMDRGYGSLLPVWMTTVSPARLDFAVDIDGMGSEREIIFFISVLYTEEGISKR